MRFWTTLMAVGLFGSSLIIPAQADPQRPDSRSTNFPRYLDRVPSPKKLQPFYSRSKKTGFPGLFPSEYRTINGYGNNLAEPEWGAAETTFLRLTAVGYDDGVSSPAGPSRPSAREISNAVVAQSESKPNRRGASDWLWQWGQFLDHDIDETPLASPVEAFPIPVPAGDPFFDPTNSGTEEIPLSRSAFDVVTGVREQINLITSYIDASNVYGSEEDRAHGLRALDGTGKLRTSSSSFGPLLPFNFKADADGNPDAGGDFFPNAALPGQPEDSLFLAGDVRVNEQLGLIAIHTLFMREHNYWAEEIAKKTSGSLSGDEIYEMARAIVAAEMQVITYNEFLPLLLGGAAIKPYKGYNPDVDAGISNVFATAAYRVGHTMLSETLLRLGPNGRPISEGNISLMGSFFNPDGISNIGLEPYFRGLSAQRSQTIDNEIVDPVRNFLFGPPGAGGFDLASLNIQRGRDHGLPGYNGVREAFGLSPLASFAEYQALDPTVVPLLEALYGTPDEMDAWVGLLGERHVTGGMVGETLSAVLVDQFVRLRDGDRFWYQNYLSKPLQQLVEKQTLSTVIQRNTRISRELQPNVFMVRGGKGQGSEKGKGKGGRP